MRLFLQLAALVSQDNDQTQKLLDLVEVVDDSDDAEVATFSSGVYELAPSASAFQIPFGGVTAAAMVVIVAWDEVDIQLGSNSAPLLPVRPTAAVPVGSALSQFQRQSQPGLVLWRGKVSSIYATNPSSTKAATLQVFLVGEAA